jgi:hypothetical protein
MASHDPQPHDPPEDEREARLQRILREMEKQLRAALPDPDQPLERIEQEVVEIGRALREIIERETVEDAGSGYVGSQTLCACGRPARYVTMNKRTLVTLNGERTFSRAYYHCAACGQGFCPLDQRFQLGRGEQSVGVRALAVRFTSYVSERKAAAELELVTGIRLSPRSMQRAGLAVGAALAADWAERERQLFAHQVAPPARRPRQLHLSMDGVYVLIGRDWKEAKVGEVYQRGATGVKQQTEGYFRTHAHRMQYQTYAAKRYHLGSGVAEAGCKQVVQARMKGAGMRWGAVGAEAMLHLRAAVCSTDPVDFRDAARRAALPS